MTGRTMIGSPVNSPATAGSERLREPPTAAGEKAGRPPPAAKEGQPAIRTGPPPLRGGPLELLRFMRRNRMLGPRYLRLLARLVRRRFLSPGGRRLRLDGLAFIGAGVRLEIGRAAGVELGRWVRIGNQTKVRCHEGLISIGAKTVLGEECTLSAYQRIAIGRECIIADRAMLIDFDHAAAEVERPIRLQGIYKRDVRVGNNVWIGYGACVLRGVTVGDNAIIGAMAVVTKDVPANAVVAGVPARVIRMRDEPRTLRWA